MPEAHWRAPVDQCYQTRSRWSDRAPERDKQELHDQVLVTALERERLLLANLEKEEIKTLIGFLHRMSAQLDAVNAVEPDVQR